MEKRGLGRGLAALIPEAAGSDAQTRIREIPVAQITANPYQPRTLFDPIKLQDLVSSIREHGILQPILVREVGHERFQIVAGERRFRAAQSAGLADVPAIVKECGERELLEMAVVENVQREDIGPMEAARAYRRMIDEFRMTQETVSQRVGKSRSSIANVLRLLDLPAIVQDSLERNEITEGHGKALLKLKDAILIQRAWERAAKEQLSVRATERIIENMLAPVMVPAAPVTPSPTSRTGIVGNGDSATFGVTSDPHEVALTEQLRQHLGTKIFVKRDAKGTGRIEIEFYNEDDLERLFEIMLDGRRR